MSKMIKYQKSWKKIIMIQKQKKEFRILKMKLGSNKLRVSINLLKKEWILCRKQLMINDWLKYIEINRINILFNLLID